MSEELEPSSTPVPDLTDLLGPELASAFAKKGYSTLTPVQRAVLSPENEGRDLRISSQTGSGKTLAIGLALRQAVTGELADSPIARPLALVIVPTRELAKQVNDELGWLYAPRKLRIASVTGGTSYRDEHRMLSSRPAVVVGTPGRLLDHLNRGGIEAGDVQAVVLDEADRMLDLGFRDELEAILEKAPEGHLTHLVSATFARDVAALADRVQANPKRIEGTPLGTANRDIDHIVYLVNPSERVDALINVLLHHPEEQTLVFARTRADVSEIARELQQAGFASGSISGEMDQNARNRALSAFKRGDIRALIATDVAARGIDVQDIARVIQVDPPTDPDTYTHRSGRTGRAGRKGVSAVLVAPAGLRRATALLQRARVQFRVEPIPTAAAIREAQDARWLTELMQGDQREVSERVRKQVERIVEAGLTERALAQLIISIRRATGEPREVTPLLPELKGGKPQRPTRFDDRRPERPRFDSERPRFDSVRPPSPPRGGDDGGDWVPFRVSWGEQQGADARRLVAMLCRRGNIRGSDIGAIRVSRTSSTVEVSGAVARGFADAAREPDPRDPRVMITPLGAGGGGDGDGGSDVEPPAEAPRRSPQRPRADVPPSEHRPPRAARSFDEPAPRAARSFDGPPPRAARSFDGPPPRAARSFDGPPPRAARSFDGPPPRSARSFDGPPPRAARSFDGPPPRANASSPRAAAKPSPAAAAKPARDTAPKRPARRVIVDAPAPRRPKKK
ncbi:MAG: ATP-dependent helicase [Polyangiaceae bacterium]|jgi:ATP-dependent RNA helicase DeaD|nr:ATP-dependent helicase [Polyangiaceae bacterium]